MAHNKTIYLFDNGGNLIQEFKTITSLSKKIGSKWCTVNTAIIRKSCLQLKYYVSYDKNFDVNSLKKKANFNPLLSKQERLGLWGSLDAFFRNENDFYYEYNY